MVAVLRVSENQARRQKISRLSREKISGVEQNPPESTEVVTLVKPEVTEKFVTYRTRYRDGGHLFEVQTEPRFRIRLHRGSELEEFETVGDFYVALRGKRLTWSLGRYLRFPAPPDPAPPIWELLAPRTKPGIDLAKRGHEVTKLLFAGFSRKIARANLDPHDVLQEVYKALLVRNEGKCPWDATKSSFAHYVYMVISCTLINMIQRRDKLPTVSDELSARKISSGSSLEEDRLVADDFGRALPDHPMKELAQKMIPLIQQGLTIKDMAESLKVDRNRVARTWTWIKDQATALLG